MKKTSLTTLITLISVISLILILSFPPKVSAKRLLPRVAPQKSASQRNAPAKSSAPRRSRGVTVKVKFRSDRRAIIANFSNLAIAKSVKYELTYKTNGVQQGVVGALDPSLEPNGTSRELLFGTCSAGVCTYHTRLSSARFIVTTTLKSGTRVIKPFRLKV